MIKARLLTIAAIAAVLSTAGFANAATDAKPAVEAAAPAAAPVPAPEVKEAMGKKRDKHHAKKKAHTS